MFVLIRALSAFYRCCLRLRYRVRLENAELLRSNDAMLFLPNHVALVDPQILFSHILKYKPVAPVMSEVYYNMPGLIHIFKLLRAVPVQDIESRGADVDFNEVFDNVPKALERGESVLIYPSGQLVGQGYERIFGKKAAHAVVQNLPKNVRVIGVRQRGLWGSMWSKAWTGKVPPMIKTFFRAFGILFANAIVFCPRRTVTIMFEDITEKALKEAKNDTDTFNTSLEEFFNADGGEEALFLKHYWFGKPLEMQVPEHVEYSAKSFEEIEERDPSAIEKEVLTTVKTVIAQVKEMKEADINDEANLVVDLFFDSLNMAEVVAMLKAKYPKSSSPSLKTVKTIYDLCYMCQGLLEDTEKLPEWEMIEKTDTQEELHIAPDKPILQQALGVLRSNTQQTACYDARSGTTTRKDLLLKAAVASRIVAATAKGEYVGIMLPAASATTTLLLASYLAKKTPVMLNWTVGEKAMVHCMKSVNVEKVLTSKAFFEIVKDQIPEHLHSHFVFLEDEVKNLNLAKKLHGLAIAKCSALLAPRQRMNDKAVVLFTSGSESLPKAVVLTHENIVRDLWGTLESYPLKERGVVCSFLPPFHSFGFTITSVLPLITGVPIVYTPNPTDVQSILKIIRHTRPHLLPSTPTFLQMLLSEASKEDLSSLITVISGAEACPQAIRDAFAQKTQKGAFITEGYGITECSPIISLNPPGKEKVKSVGKCITGIDCCIADIETHKKLPAGEEGMIYVRGKSIFGGYIDSSIASPFEEVEGQEYYKTGDLGYLDEDGYLFITGRLKRFIKIAGEMISLPFIESILLEKYGVPGEAVLAVEGSDKTDPSVVKLFAVHNIDKDEANAYLRSKGVSNLIQIHEVVQIEEIPVLGTGKIDYKVLKKQIES